MTASSWFRFWGSSLERIVDYPIRAELGHFYLPCKMKDAVTCCKYTRLDFLPRNRIFPMHMMFTISKISVIWTPCLDARWLYYHAERILLTDSRLCCSRQAFFD